MGDSTGKEANVGIRGVNIGRVLRPILPDPDTDPDRGFTKCGYSNFVLADTSSLESIRNDVKGFIYQVQRASDTFSIRICLLYTSPSPRD